MQRIAGLLLASAVLSGCGALPAKSHPEPRAVSGDFGSTRLAQVARASQPPGQSSGFRLLPDGEEAFAVREQLIQSAELTIDAQTYYVADDSAGLGFLAALEAAAARGVRVRLLVDDLHSAGIDPVLARLARLPGFEVRLFNPFCCARASVLTRVLSSLLATVRPDRRMHNKLLVVDQRFAVAGGRNMADEYFGRSEAEAFIDIDALMAGDVVSQLGSIFERYWHSDPVWPASDILQAPAWSPGLPASVHSEISPPTRDGQRPHPVHTELATGRVQLIGGEAYAFADSPSKTRGGDDDYLQATSVLTRARETILTARSEVVIATPYLIPRTRGLAMMHHLQEQGVRMRILTNGAASNDSKFAHAGYALYRRAILERGVDLHEVSGAGSAPGSGAGRQPAPVLRLHAKAFTVDRRTVFIGSTNFDPRSSDRNTELGILVDSGPLAEQMAGVIDAARLNGALHVRIDSEAQNRLQWVQSAGQGPVRVFDHEPGASLLHWLEHILLLSLVSEDLL